MPFAGKGVHLEIIVLSKLGHLRKTNTVFSLWLTLCGAWILHKENRVYMYV